MNVYTYYELKNDLNSVKYLRENSYWYKYLNRDGSYVKNLKEEMKVGYKLTFEDKLDRFSKNLDKALDIIDIFF